MNERDSDKKMNKVKEAILSEIEEVEKKEKMRKFVCKLGTLKNLITCSELQERRRAR